MAKESMKAREVKRENGSNMLRKKSFVRSWRFRRFAEITEKRFTSSFAQQM
jgi:hypothetical protein